MCKVYMVENCNNPIMHIHTKKLSNTKPIGQLVRIAGKINCCVHKQVDKEPSVQFLPSKPLFFNADNSPHIKTLQTKQNLGKKM